MNVYDYAHSLAKAIQTSMEYRKYREALGGLKADKASYQMLADFRQQQLEMQRRKMAGEETSADEEKVKKLSELLFLNELVRNYLTDEYRFAQLMADVQKILAKAIEPEETTES